jgi:Nucleotidyltransferase of unknown function (DUF6036)
VQPDPSVRQEYLDAFREIVLRIAKTLANAPRKTLPVRMFVAGGAAMYLHTGGRVSEDIDAVFSRRLALPEDLEVSYRDTDGLARFLYFDRQYNDTFGLLHEDAYDDSVALVIEGIDPAIVEVRLLSPLDLAVSKIARLSDPDRDDIARLAHFGLVKADALRRRAEEALSGFVGDVERLKSSIEIAYRIAQDAERQAPGKGKRR